MIDKINIFPEKSQLKQATLQALQELGGKATTKEINAKVAQILNLSEEVLAMEDENGVGTVYEYRMRWIRTELKGQILNPKKGHWVLAESQNLE